MFRTAKREKKVKETKIDGAGDVYAEPTSTK
jgi:hypothetical protein